MSEGAAGVTNNYRLAAYHAADLGAVKLAAPVQKTVKVIADSAVRTWYTRYAGFFHRFNGRHFIAH